ncbi:hypothetical protein J2X13_005503 [Aminobacter aminovorans]|nr:hypothetical protein [Aminobacter aminovorans]
MLYVRLASQTFVLKHLKLWGLVRTFGKIIAP